MSSQMGRSHKPNGHKQRPSRRHRRGAAAIEYAITLCVIVSGVAVIADLGKGLTDPFEQVASLDNATESKRSLPQEVVVARANEDAEKAMKVGHESLAALMVFGAMSAIFVVNLSRKRQRKKDIADKARIRKDKNAQRQEALTEKRNGMLSVMGSDLTSALNSRVEVAHLMSMKPRFVQPEHPISGVRKIMRQEKLRHVMVCHEDKLIGVIGEGNVGCPDAKYAADVMIRDPTCVRRDTLLIPAVTTMMNKRHSCLPVTEKDKRLVGVLTRTDLLLAFQCILHLTVRKSTEQQECPAATGADESESAVPQATDHDKSDLVRMNDICDERR